MLKENLVKIFTPPSPAVFALILSALLVLTVQVSFAQTHKGKKEVAVKKETVAKADPAPKSDPTPKNKSIPEKESKGINELTQTSLEVVSDRMIAQQDKSMVEFIGNARATREDSIVSADSIKIFFHTAETKQEAQNNVKEIVSTGNVEYTSGERKAFADKAVYTVETEILVLTGKSPRLVTGESHVTGKKITLFRKEDKVLVESDDKTRVQAVFNPEDQKKGIDP